MAVEESRLSKLKKLEQTLAVNMECCETRELAPLARQYREVLREIEEIEGAEAHNDEIGEILSRRDTDGKPGAVRQNRSGVQGE